jgi:hypothetical protein
MGLAEREKSMTTLNVTVGVSVVASFVPVIVMV